MSLLSVVEAMRAPDGFTVGVTCLKVRMRRLPGRSSTKLEVVKFEMRADIIPDPFNFNPRPKSIVITHIFYAISASVLRRRGDEEAPSWGCKKYG
jgi:hypothetical protein